MNTQLLALAAAALLSAASISRAAPSELQRYTDRAEARAQVLLHASGLDFATQSVSVRATVNPDGRLGPTQVLRSSGSRADDLAVETVLRKIVMANPPLGLTDGAVTLNVGGARIVEAKAR